jgi:hypothetical protein
VVAAASREISWFKVELLFMIFLYYYGEREFYFYPPLGLVLLTLCLTLPIMAFDSMVIDPFALKALLVDLPHCEPPSLEPLPWPSL